MQITFTAKLKELQEQLFVKMKELNTARIQNLPLKAEIESLRLLIDEEEKRYVAFLTRYKALVTRAQLLIVMLHF